MLGSGRRFGLRPLLLIGGEANEDRLQTCRSRVSYSVDAWQANVCNPHLIANNATASFAMRKALDLVKEDAGEAIKDAVVRTVANNQDLLATDPLNRDKQRNSGLINHSCSPLMPPPRSRKAGGWFGKSDATKRGSRKLPRRNVLWRGCRALRNLSCHWGRVYDHTQGRSVYHLAAGTARLWAGRAGSRAER